MQIDDKDTPEFDFDSLAQAMVSGNSEELNRLMDVKATPDPELNDDSAEKPKEGEEKVDDTPEPVEKPSEGEEAKVDTPEPAQPEPSEIEQLRAEVHRLRSDAGRVPYVQRRNQELERELQQLRAKDAAAKAAPTTKDDVELDEETKAIIDELKETDPVMAKAYERVAKLAVSTANAKVNTAFEEFTRTAQESDDERYYNEQKAVLVERVPQAYQIFATNEWQQWKQGLTPARRAMAESPHADEVVTAIYAFAADMQALRGGAPQQPAPAQPAPAASEPAADEAAIKAAQARNRKVATAAEVSSSAAKATEEFDEAKMFEEMYTQIGKANHVLRS